MQKAKQRPLGSFEMGSLNTYYKIKERKACSDAYASFIVIIISLFHVHHRTKASRNDLQFTPSCASQFQFMLGKFLLLSLHLTTWRPRHKELSRYQTFWFLNLSFLEVNACSAFTACTVHSAALVNIKQCNINMTAELHIYQEIVP